MKPSKDLDEQIDEILTKLENAVEHSTLRRVANRQDVSNKTIHAASKQQLLALIEQREREAKIRAFWEIVSEWDLDVKSKWFSSSGGAVDLVSMAEYRIAELQKGEL